MMLSSVCFLRIYFIARKEIKVVEPETLFMLVNGVTLVWPQILFKRVLPQKVGKAHLKVF